MSSVARAASELPRKGDASNMGIRSQESTLKKEETSKSSVPKTKSNQALAEQTKKGRKRESPFRIKAGCLVALRHSDGGNKVTAVLPSGKTNDLSNLRSVEHFVDVWADPMPGRDEGLALIGKRVRCFFPKFVLAENQPKRATTRILEGEIVALPEYESNWLIQQQRRRNREACHFTVELLVDASALVSLPFLQRVDESVDFANMRPSEKKRQQYEEIIRGKGKIAVRVTLADHSKIALSKGLSQQLDLVSKWAIRKRVPLKVTGTARYEQLFGEEIVEAAANETLKENSALTSPDNGNTVHTNGVSGPDISPLAGPKSQDSKTRSVQRADSGLEPPKKRAKPKRLSNEVAKSRYLGDGNDTPVQQETNWRWWAGRAHSMELVGGNALRIGLLEQISFGFVGEVLSVAREPSPSSTLAMVTVRRMILPEQTINGRLVSDAPFQLYDDMDTVVESATHGSAPGNNFVTFRVPVEQMVIVLRGFIRTSQVNLSSEIPLNNPTVALAYSFKKNVFRSIPNSCEELPNRDLDEDSSCCHRCRIALPARSMKRCGAFCADGERQSKLWCDRCVPSLHLSSAGASGFPCCSGTCTCSQCRLQAVSHLQQKLRLDVMNVLSNAIKSEQNPKSLFEVAHRSIQGISPTGFNLPANFFDSIPFSMSSGKPISKIQKPRSRKDKKPSDKMATDGQTTEAQNKRKSNVKRKNGEQTAGKESQHASCERNKEQSELCSRLVPYDPKDKPPNASLKTGEAPASELFNFCDMPRNLRQLQLLSTKPEREDKTNNSRAARANQRRIMKDVVALGATSLGLDTLAGREQKLRFDRSGIHAWGVFADEAIAAGDMIVEYRGELIGNAMAEKREKEYERAKIGSDYMFRVDSQVVCDATKQGNVARFINASCDPNCYTKTITVDGTKRIVVYAKRDIRAGEELCYDYKFPLEYEESKRIPCFCGAKECRGFMNWDKRYIALPVPSLAVRDDITPRRVSLKHTEE